MYMEPQGYLTERGKGIFLAIAEYLDKKGFDEDCSFELSMLANSFDMYARAAEACNTEDRGYAQVTKTGYSQVKADYTVMKTEYVNVLKHSGKFGLNPLDVQKMLKNLPEKKEVSELENLISA